LRAEEVKHWREKLYREMASSVTSEPIEIRSTEKPPVSNPFRQLCELALRIREQELARDLSPAHQRTPHVIEHRAALEDQLLNLLADCCVASERWGDGREREVEIACRLLVDACRDLLVWEAAERLGRLTAEEAASEKGGPCVALCNRLRTPFDRVDHYARLYDRR
jgi:hypothetical protein